jgi:F0F1-type ATP synthase assembly protein I
MPKEDKNQTEKATSQATGTGVALWLIAGIVIGSITGDVGLWLSLGIVFGAAFSVVKKKKLAPDGDSEHP